MGWGISFVNEWEEHANYFGEGAGISKKWANAHFLAFLATLGTVMAAAGVSVGWLMHYNECTMRLEVRSSTIFSLEGSNQFMSYPQKIFHFFKACALLPSPCLKKVGKAHINSNVRKLDWDAN